MIYMIVKLYCKYVRLNDESHYLTIHCRGHWQNWKSHTESKQIYWNANKKAPKMPKPKLWWLMHAIINYTSCNILLWIIWILSKILWCIVALKNRFYRKFFYPVWHAIELTKGSVKKYIWSSKRAKGKEGKASNILFDYMFCSVIEESCHFIILYFS
jgi:hypothetical protein